VFTTNAETGRYGPGHNSFTGAEDGVTDVLVYHARSYRDITGDPLFDPNRHTRVQRLHRNEDGTPSFGVPVGAGGPIVRLSPLDSPHLVVRHAEFRLRVEGNVREVADSQFRLVPGNLGAGTVSVRSVNFPTGTCGPATACCASNRSPTRTTTAPPRASSACARPGGGRAERERATFHLS
jgi:hypothetical protein